MHFRSTIVAAVAAAGANIVSGMPTARQAAPLSPCANITQQYARAVASNASSFFADGQLAYECGMSMPFDSVRASAFLIEFRKYLLFQSTIPVLKNPPGTYLSPAVDLLGGFDSIYKKANTSQYRSQYEMDIELSALLNSAADGHLGAGLCSTSIFSFTVGAQNEIISISENGTSLPKLYLVRDAALSLRTGTNVSSIVRINGQNATQYLETIGLTSGSQDPDAQYNNVFASSPRGAAGQGLEGSFVFNPVLTMTPNVSMTFANGSTYNIRVVASVPVRFNYTNGTALYNSFCLPATSTSSTSTSPSTSATPTVTPPPAAYPYPVIRDPSNLILGYYLNATGYNDTAVLFVPSFETSGYNGSATFAYVASTFINRAAADGKTKMIIDVSGNGGGTITAGFDLYKLFFPNNTAYSYTRQRDHDSQRLTWKSFASLNSTEADGDDLITLFNYKKQTSPDQSSNFSSWQQLYGPDNINGANMTSIYANFNFTLESAMFSPVRGYGGVPLNVTRQLFSPENILIMSDGRCASTCTTFVNLMTNSTSPGFGNVRTLTFGGRPIDKPMQVMGGVRGAQSISFSTLADAVDTAFVYAYNRTNTTNPPLTKVELALFEQVGPRPLSSLPLQLNSASLNLRNSYNPGDLKTPLQFAYQASDCKLFYTYQNVINPASSWVSAAQAAWGNGTCVPGSMSAGFKLP